MSRPRLQRLCASWITPSSDGLEFAPRTFKAARTGLHVLFGPNNAGKTRLLKAIAAGFLSAELTGPELRDTHQSIKDFPGPNGDDLWPQLGSVLIRWGRTDKQAALDTASLAVAREILFSHLPPEQVKNFADLVRTQLRVEPYRNYRFIPTNRFLPSNVPIQEHSLLYDLVSRGAALDRPEQMALALADLADSPEPQYRKRFDRIRDRFRQIVDATIKVGRVGATLFLSVDDGQSSRPLADCGDGLRDVLGLLLHIECFQDCDLFIDDPGLRLHAGAQRRVLGVLEEEASKRAIWIATHDLVFIAARSAGGRYAVSRREGVTVVTSVTDLADVRDAIRHVGWLPADAFVADTLVCCEGPSDRYVFADRLSREPFARYSGVVVADLGGVAKVWGPQRQDLLRLAEVARSAVAHGRVVALIDRDQHSDHEIETLSNELERRNVGLKCLARPE